MPNAGKRVEIIQETPVAGVPGVSTIHYRVLALNAKGEIQAGQYVQSGKVFTKTVYDPAIYSDEMMMELGRKAFKDAMDNNRFDITPAMGRSFVGVVENQTIYGHYTTNGSGEKTLKTWWIER